MALGASLEERQSLALLLARSAKATGEGPKWKKDGTICNA
jgi:hypothetical protein